MKNLFKKSMAIATVTILAASMLQGYAQQKPVNPQELLQGRKAALIKTAEQAQTINSIKDEFDGKFYTMTYYADYMLDTLLAHGVCSNDEMTMFVAKYLLKPMVKDTIKADAACSAFQAVTPEGDIIYGRNLDYSFASPCSLMSRFAPKDGGYKSISMESLPFIGYKQGDLSDTTKDLSMVIGAPYMNLDGMNEKGVAMSVLQLSKRHGFEQYDPAKKNLYTTAAIRYVLDRAASTDQAIEMLSQYNMFAYAPNCESRSFHFLISDASGKTVVLEYIQPEGSTEWVMSVIDAKFVCNKFLTPGWDEGKEDCWRYTIIKKKFAETNGVLTEEEAMELLSAVSQKLKPEELTSNTQWSAVYNLTKRTVTLCFNRDYTRRFTYSLFEKTPDEPASDKKAE